MALQHATTIPGGNLETGKMPGHWLLARLGKRVLRPGGLTLTRTLLGGLRIGAGDHVVELAPGLGVTARLVLEAEPATYTGVDRDADAVAYVERFVRGAGRRCTRAPADATGLPDGSATVVIAEAMLSMQTPAGKAAIVREAARCLHEGGRLAIHELALVPDRMAPEVREAIEGALSESIHVGARPLTRLEWEELLVEAGFEIEQVYMSPMHLLEPRRLLKDEGWRLLRMLWSALRDPAARRRVHAMRAVFRQHDASLKAIGLIARKR